MTRSRTWHNVREALGTPTGNSGISVFILVIFYILTPIPIESPALAQTLLPAQTLVFVLSSLHKYTDKDLQKAIHLALKLIVKGQKQG